MKLWEALKLLDEGKKVRRKTWDRIDYLYKEDDEIKKNLSRNLVLELADLTYVDWEEYDNRKELPTELNWLKDAYKFFNDSDECYGLECKNCPLNNTFGGYTDPICDILDLNINGLNKLCKLDK